MKLTQSRIFVLVVALAILHIPLVIFLRSRGMIKDLETVSARETPLAREVREKVEVTGSKSFDELVQDMTDDWINQHSQLFVDEGPATSWFFDAVIANPNNIRLIFEIEKQFSGARRSGKVLEVFDRYFAYYWDGISAQTQAREEVARVLRTQGKHQLTLEDFHTNRRIGISKFPEGWSEIGERTNGILNATFLVANFCSFQDVCKSILRFRQKQQEMNTRLRAIGYPDIEDDNVGLEREFLVSILWYASDPSRAGQSPQAASIRRIIDKAVERDQLRRLNSRMLAWNPGMSTKSKVDPTTTPSEMNSKPVDRFRWSCGDKDRIAIVLELVDCIAKPAVD